MELPYNFNRLLEGKEDDLWFGAGVADGQESSVMFETNNA